MQYPVTIGRYWYPKFFRVSVFHCLSNDINNRVKRCTAECYNNTYFLYRRNLRVPLLNNMMTTTQLHEWEVSKFAVRSVNYNKRKFKISNNNSDETVKYQ